MESILFDLSAQVLAAAIENNMYEYFQYLSRSESVEIYEKPNMYGFITGISHPFMNGIFRIIQPTADEIDEVITLFKSRKFPFIWWMGSVAQSTDWRKQLENHGLVFGDDLIGMAADLRALNEDLASPSNLFIEPVGDKETLEKFANTAVMGFGLPQNGEKACFDLFAGLGFDMPLRNYLGMIDGKPVATSQLFLAAGVAGIYWVATIPEARKQGIGMAMTLAPLQEARDMGYRIAILHPSEMGLGVYQRIGFEKYCNLSHGIWIDKTQ